jgi:chromosome segregation ATPase
MDRELLTAINELLDKKLEPIRSQQQEDHAIIKALMHTSEVENAEIDGLKWTVTHIEGRLTVIEDRLTGVEGEIKELQDGQERIEIVLNRVEADIKDVRESQRALCGMYGEHEIQIGELRRKVAST